MTRSAPIVTVLVATYNAAPFIRETLASVLAQTLPDLEILVIDDGSTDGTAGVIAATDDARVQLITRSNAGPGAALNEGVARARAPYLAFLDHDDLWEPNHVERHVLFLERHPDVDLTFSWARFINATGKRLSLHSPHYVGRAGFRDLLADYAIGPTTSVMLRRAVLDRAGLFDPAFLRYYDMDLFLRIAQVRPDNIHAIPEELALYRRRCGQLSSDWEGMRRDWSRLLGKFRRLAPVDTAAVEAQGDANMHRYFAFLAYENRQYRDALRLLRYAARRANRRFITDSRNQRMLLACIAGSVVPSPLFKPIEELAGLR